MRPTRPESRIISSGTVRRMSKYPSSENQSWFMQGVATGLISALLLVIAVQLVFGLWRVFL